jgi:hypothetical protein
MILTTFNRFASHATHARTRSMLITEPNPIGTVLHHRWWKIIWFDIAVSNQTLRGPGSDFTPRIRHSVGCLCMCGYRPEPIHSAECVLRPARFSNTHHASQCFNLPPFGCGVTKNQPPTNVTSFKSEGLFAVNACESQFCRCLRNTTCNSVTTLRARHVRHHPSPAHGVRLDCCSSSHWP